MNILSPGALVGVPHVSQEPMLVRQDTVTLHWKALMWASKYIQLFYRFQLVDIIFVQIYDYEYDHKDPKEESVLHDHAWGFCDPKCFVGKEDILALDLQEVPFCLEKYIGWKTHFIR